MAARSGFLHQILFLTALAILMQGCAMIEIRSLQKPHINMAGYRTFTTLNQAKSGEENYLRDEVLLDHTSDVMSELGYLQSSPKKAQARVTLVFNEGFKKVFIPPATEPIISYTEGEFTTVTGTVNGETIHFFGYIPPMRVERYVGIPAHEIDVYKLMLRIDIYDSRSLSKIWTGTAYKESTQG
ncbi:MAG TPA: hypothetical protein ENH04_01595, partial [Nitrospirae bacterium]|nr:hypothetical protein [Nitrospirota bacterium]